MKNAVLVLSFFLVVPAGWAQTATQLDECRNAVTKEADPDISPSICSVVLGQLRPNEHVAAVDSAGVMTVTDGIIHEYPLPWKLESTLLLAKAKRSYEELEKTAELGGQDNLAVAVLPGYKDDWAKDRDLFCKYHPGDAYSDLSDAQQFCPDSGDILAAADGNTGNAGRATSLGPQSLNGSGTKTCDRAITFAAAQNGGLVYRVPNVSQKWFDKAEKKFPNVCFLQYDARSGRQNYLVVLSSSSSAFNGLQPVFHRTTTTEPVSGSGTLTDNAGAIWDFTYQGTMTTTTTTESNLPYTDATGYLYANAYDEAGVIMGSSESSVTTRQGGDPSNALGYNLTSALLSIHVKEHLIEEIVKKVSTHP